MRRAGRVVAVVDVGHRRTSAVVGPSLPERATTADLTVTVESAGAPSSPKRLLDPGAWNETSAARAAVERWRDRHRSILTVHHLWLADPSDAALAAAALEEVGSHLVGFGIRRLDVLVAPGSPLLAGLRDRGWVTGSVRQQVLASRPLRYPWMLATDISPRLAALLDHLPPRPRRLARRIVAMHPWMLWQLVRTAVSEVREAIRHRYAPGRARAAPLVDAPDGTTPFAVTRYRTMRAAFDLVPPALWTGTFVDIGAGDGRVLGEALRAGAAGVAGRELDPDLAARAQQHVGPRGHVEAGDALSVPLPSDSTIVFLNNPFGVDSLGQLADLIGASRRAHPRPLVVIYINPPTVAPLIDAGLVLVQCTPTYSVLAGASEAVRYDPRAARHERITGDD